MDKDIFNLRTIFRRNIIKLNSYKDYIKLKHRTFLKFELDLSYTNTIDVRMLGGVHTLNLENTKVRDVRVIL
jgi:hypothetical protein